MYGELEKKNDSERVKLAFLLISYLFTVALFQVMSGSTMWKLFLAVIVNLRYYV